MHKQSQRCSFLVLKIFCGLLKTVQTKFNFEFINSVFLNRMKQSMILIILTFILNLQCKRYTFQVTYECKNQYFVQVKNRHTKQLSYECKNWVQDVIIRQKKVKYIRFQSSQYKEEQQLYEQQEQQQQKQVDEEIKQQEVQQKKQQQEKQQNQQKQQAKQGKQETNLRRHNNQRKLTSNYEQSSKERHKIENKQLQLHRKLKLKQPKQTDHSNQSRPVDVKFKDKVEQIREVKHESRHHLFRENSQQKEGQQKQIIPIKSHHYNPVKDVFFILQTIKMNSIILENP